MRIACLNFKTSLIPYKQNKFHQVELVKLTHGLLMNMQKELGAHGQYDEYYKSHDESNTFYIRSLINHRIEIDLQTR